MKLSTYNETSRGEHRVCIWEDNDCILIEWLGLHSYPEALSNPIHEGEIQINKIMAFSEEMQESLLLLSAFLHERISWKNSSQ